MIPLKSPLIPDANINHGFFTREGGCSDGIYDSLNCGLGSDDDNYHVMANRQRVLSILGTTGSQLCGLYQNHSNIVHFLETPWDDQNMPKGDAVVTKQKNIALGILTADCAPVLFADTHNKIIAAAHAGWKGALNGILENTINMMCRHGAEMAHISATIGPCISQESYEVGPEFYHHFFDDDPTSNNCFIKSQNPHHYLFDLRRYILDRLNKTGITHSVALPQDTYQDEEKFFSYRRTTHRGEKDYGRQISSIIIL